MIRIRCYSTFNNFLKIQVVLSHRHTGVFIRIAPVNQCLFAELSIAIHQGFGYTSKMLSDFIRMSTYWALL